MNTTQILNKLAGLTKMVNDILTLGKRFDEFPAKEILDPASKILVSTDGTSETLLIQQIIDYVNNESQNNKVRSVLLGTISEDRTFAYILDTTGLTVAPDENVILSVLDPIDSDSDIQQYRERVFLWKLGKGTFGPIGSEDLDTKLFELPSIYPTEESAEDLVNSPEAIVRDYGIITDDILEAINTANPAVDYDLDSEDMAFTYYVRATLEDIKYLYQFRGENGIYGFGAGQMASEDLVLIYSSSNTGTVDGSAYVTRASIGDVTIDTDEIDLILPNRNRFGFVLKNTGNNNILGIDNSFRNEAFPVGTPVAIANRTGVNKTLKDMVSNPDIRPFELPFGDLVVENNTLTVFKNTGSTLLFQSYSKMNTGATQAYVDAQDAANLVAAKAYADSQDVTILNAAKSYSDTQDTATLNAAKTYAEGLVTGLVDLRGNYNPSINSNLYPTAGGSGTSGAVKKGDVWLISGLGVGVSALIGTKTVTDGDEIMSLIDAPGNTDSNWNITEHNFTYVPENTANKTNSGTMSTSSVLFPTEGKVKTYVDAKTVLRTYAISMRYNGGTAGNFNGLATLSTANTFSVSTGSATLAGISVTADIGNLFVAPFDMILISVTGQSNYGGGSGVGNAVAVFARTRPVATWTGKTDIFEATVQPQQFDFTVTTGILIPKGYSVCLVLGVNTGTYGLIGVTFKEVV